MIFQYSQVFQSTLPRRERPAGQESTVYRTIYFNPRSREGSDESQYHYASTSSPFQSTLPRRERLCCLDAIIQLQDFNPRSREGSDCTKLLSSKIWLNFNPRSREGSDDMTGYLDAEGTISIHAPAKGATATTLLRLPEWKFQSTLPRRERLMWLDISVVGTIVFQSTLPRRERRLKRLKPRMRKEFQSTLPRRERPSCVCCYPHSKLFQSTLPRRERLYHVNTLPR